MVEIIESYINGQIKQAIRFMSDYNHRLDHDIGIDIVNCSLLFGLYRTISILKKLGTSDTNIVNAFYDYNDFNLDEARDILSNIKHS